MQRYDYPAIGETLYCDTLRSGLRLQVVTKPCYARSHAMLAVNYGGADRRFLLKGKRRDTPMGVAHYLEHKMVAMPEGDAMFTMAASGAQPNAFTSAWMTAYYFDTTEEFETNLRTLLRFVSTPYFPEESVEKERGIIGQEIAMTEDDPDFVSYTELLRSLYAHHPLRDPVVGTAESIQAITPKVLELCHKVFYHPSNLALTVVGDVEPEQVMFTASEILRPSPDPAPVRDYGEAEAPEPQRRRFTRAMEVSAPQFLLGVRLPDPGTGPERLRRRLLGDLTLSCLYRQSTPFFTRLYGEGLLNTDFFTEIDTGRGTATLLAGGESREPERVFDRFLELAERVASEGLDEAVFARKKKAFYGKSVRGLAAFGGLCENLAEAAFGGYRFLDAFAVLESLRAEDVQDYVRQALRREGFAMSVIRPLREKEAESHA